ncbi:C6 transcription factor [Fusarium denticulatum]|uniref:C6 transcription factor n=1 Tax=Fusarium denticulatum TaxID=48507 RepID=A0A8H5WVA7_9HYPO|nr:C6 transcription factor [Fusarium denticulatum]
MIKGRPLRIRLEDGDISPASIQDMKHDLTQLPDAIRNLYFPFEIQRICRFWCKLVEISLLLGTIVLKTAGQAEATEDHLSACGWPEEDVDIMHPCEKMCAYHNRLLYCATCVAFWRPRVVSSSRGEQQSDSERVKATEKAREAAVRSNGVLESILSHGLLRYMKSQSISALVPPMQIHLLDCKSSTTSVRVLGANRLQLCMQILVELKETYWAAEFALKLFERAYEWILRQSKRGESNASLLGDSRSQPVQILTTPPLQGLSTPSSDSLLSIDEIFMPDYDFGGYSRTDILWRPDIEFFCKLQ